MDNLELGLLIRGHLLIRPLQALRLVARWGGSGNNEGGTN